VGSGASSDLLCDLVDGGFVVVFHAFGAAVVEVEYVEFGEFGVVEAGFFDDVFE